jgi:hypothetical protein
MYMHIEICTSWQLTPAEQLNSVAAFSFNGSAISALDGEEWREVSPAMAAWKFFVER